MKVMQCHDWFDDAVDGLFWDSGSHKDVREIDLKMATKTILISKQDVIALAKEFYLVIYERNAEL